MATIESILAAGRADYLLGRKAALRSLIWFGFGAHEVLHNGTSKEQNAYFDDLRAILRESGAVKSEVSTKAKQAKQIGKAFTAMFARELATNYASEADFVQACFVTAQASGATSVARLIDWAVNGDPDATDKAKAAKEEERKAEKEAARAEALAAIDAAPAAQMGFDSEPALAPEKPVQNLNHAGVTGNLDQACAVMRRLSDADLALLAKEVAAEIATRASAASAAA